MVILEQQKKRSLIRSEHILERESTGQGFTVHVKCLSEERPRQIGQIVHSAVKAIGVYESNSRCTQEVR